MKFVPAIHLHPLVKKGLFFLPLVILLTLVLFFERSTYEKTQLEQQKLKNTNTALLQKIENVNHQLQTLQSEDQYVKNEKLQKEIENIKKTYQQAVATYEEMAKLRTTNNKTDTLFALTLAQLAENNYASAQATLSLLTQEIKNLQQKAIEKTPQVATNAPKSNTAPSSGYSVQVVGTEIGEFTIQLIAADLNSTRVIVDTASESDCANDCPVLSLQDYVSRNGAFAGINGSYFCPASYPSCAGKTNSFDTLLMNKNKKYFNSDNNVYSTVPVAVFGPGWARFMGRSSDWGRDTSVDAVIANQGLLLSGGNITFGGDGDPKKGSKGNRSFIGNKGSTVYIGVVHNATVAEVAHVLKALGLENALNLDSGGSTALWSGGYKVGPGRNIPNAILFVRR